MGAETEVRPRPRRAPGESAMPSGPAPGLHNAPAPPNGSPKLATIRKLDTMEPRTKGFTKPKRKSEPSTNGRAVPAVPVKTVLPKLPHDIIDDRSAQQQNADVNALGGSDT